MWSKWRMHVFLLYICPQLWCPVCRVFSGHLCPHDSTRQWLKPWLFVCEEDRLRRRQRETSSSVDCDMMVVAPDVLSKALIGNTLEYSQFMGLSWRNHATLWLFPWGFIYCRGTALANKYEFRLISSCLVIIKSLSKDIINMQRVSLIICMGYSWVQAFPFFCA